MNVFILSAKTTKHCLVKKTQKKKSQTNITPITWEFENIDAGKCISFLTSISGIHCGQSQSGRQG